MQLLDGLIFIDQHLFVLLLLSGQLLSQLLADQIAFQAGDVEDQYGYAFPSRTKLVQRIKNQDYIIQKMGEGRADIRPIVDMYFTRAANKMIDLIKKRWKKYPDIQCFYVVGGGASALKPYMLEAAGPLKLRFVEQSELQNVFGYLKLARSKMNQSALF